MRKMKPIWVIEKQVFDDGNSERIAELAKATGHEVIWTDMDYRNNKKISSIPDDACVVSYGSMNMVSWLLSSKSWMPNCWFNGQTLNCTNYYSFWGAYILQREYAFYTWAELKRLYVDVYNRFSDSNNRFLTDAKIFLRPCNHIKTFTGAVVPYEKFEHWYNQNNKAYSPQPEMLVVVAKPQPIIAEWRFVIVDNEVITYSIYAQNGPNLLTDSDTINLLDFVQKVLADKWKPDEAYTLDICQIEGGEFKVLEIGSVNTSALYNCDCKAYFEAMNKMAVKAWDDIWDADE